MDQQRVEILNDISRTLFSTGDIGGILKRVASLIKDLLSVDTVLMYNVQEKTGNLDLVAYQGLSLGLATPLSYLKAGESMYFKVVAEAFPLVVRMDEEQSYLGEIFHLAGITRLLIAPLMMRSRVIGIVCAGVRNKREFSREDIDLLSAVGIQVAMAIENARLKEEQMQITGKLAVSESGYRWLFENASDAIWANDSSGNIIVANRAAADLMGNSVQNIIGSNVHHYLTEKGLATARRVREILISGQSLEQPYEQRLRRKDGSEIILMVTTSMARRGDESPIFEHVARDVTRERHMQENLKYFFQQITRSQEEERKRIARDLHDDTAQALYALTRQMDNYLRTSEGLAPETVDFLKGLRDQIRTVSQGVRRFSQDLRPPILDDLGLLATLRWALDDMKQRLGIDTHLELTGGERRLGSDVELTIYRICQEALHNIEKHASATSVEIKVFFDAWKVQISIIDNGSGFNVPGEMESLPREGRLGLVGMEERVRLLGGTIRIESSIGRGTCVMIQLPV